MARCAHDRCGERISYRAYWASLPRNAVRSGVSLVVTCAACGGDNVQPALHLAMQLGLAAVVMGVVGAAVGDRAIALPMLLVAYGIVELFWWTLFTTLERRD